MEEEEIIWCNEEFWKDPSNMEGSNFATQVTATLMGKEILTLIDKEDEDSFKGSECLAVAVLVSSSISGWQTDIDQVYEGKKYLFSHIHGPGLVYAAGWQPLVYGVREEDLGSPDDVVGSIHPWPRLWQQEDAEPANWRGAFYPSYHRKVLFSKTMKLETASLPRWKPNISIEIRSLELADD
jgi:hypothetical protein